MPRGDAVTLRGLTIERGRDPEGGGVREGWRLRLRDVVIRDNRGQFGAGVDNRPPGELRLIGLERHQGQHGRQGGWRTAQPGDAGRCALWGWRQRAPEYAERLLACRHSRFRTRAAGSVAAGPRYTPSVEESRYTRPMADPSPVHTAEIIAVGSELLVGETRDTNSGDLARELNTLGVDVLRISQLPDDLDVVVASHARQRAGVPTAS